MSWRGFAWSPKRPAYLAVISLLLLVLGFLFDLSTTQSLVIAITYNIPIALSSLALSRRLTLVLVGLALVANALAGYANVLALGGVNPLALANRSLAALSFLVVGILTLMLRNASARVTALQLSAAQAKRERDLRIMGSELSEPMHPQALMERSCEMLRTLLEAEAVVISGVENSRFAEPQFRDPSQTVFAKRGEPAAWLIKTIPVGAPSASTAHAAGMRLAVGRWHRRESGDLLVVVIRPRDSDANILLGEALHDLEPLLERAVLLQSLDQQRNELARRNAIIRDLAYAFSHDLRTPLMANAMNMRLALEGAFGEMEPEYQRTLENGLQANEDLLELADALLLVARYESGEVLKQPESVNLLALLHETLARLEPLWQSKSLKVEIDAPECVTVLGRPSELRRVLQNLLHNAAKFAPPKSKVEISLGLDQTSDPEMVRLEVLDRGSGVSSVVEPRLFQRFSTGKAGGGTGLGLYLSRQIVTAHGGKVAYTPRDGGGSHFTVFLPLFKVRVPA